MKTQIVDILQESLAEHRITPFDSFFVLDTLHSFLSKYSDYEPRSSRTNHITTDGEMKPWTADEEILWKTIQPILDKAQEFNASNHPGP